MLQMFENVSSLIAEVKCRWVSGGKGILGTMIVLGPSDVMIYNPFD